MRHLDVKLTISAAVAVAALVVGPLALAQSGKSPGHEHRKIVLTSPLVMDVEITRQYVGRIHSRRHIKVRALKKGLLDEIQVREGQSVKQGDLMFKIAPALQDARPDADSAGISAPFDGIVDRIHEQLGSLIKEGDVLTTLSDNSVMWVYFNVPENQYLEYMSDRKLHEADKIELRLANQARFSEPGKLGAIEAEFNNETGNIPFRADFPNPDGLLRHGQTGTVLVSRTQKGAVVIPQRATFELLDKRYVWVVGEDDVAHQRPISVQHELEDIFVVGKGLDVKDRIVLEGVREVREGQKVEHEYRRPQEALKNQKFHAD